MKSKLLPLLFVVLALAGLFFWWQQETNANKEGPILLYGNVDIREVELAFREGGRLTTMHYQEGAAVNAGDLLAELDPQPFLDTIAIAQADVKNAQAALAKMVGGYRRQNIRQAEATVLQAEATLTKAEKELTRQQKLIRTKATSQQSVDTAQAARDEAAAALASARQALSLQKEGFQQEDILASEAQLERAEAVLAQAQTALADTQLTAPKEGIIISRIVEPGSMVNVREGVYTLSLRNPLYVRAYASETDLGHVAPGSKVTLTTDSSPKVYHGHIGFVSPKAEFTPKSVETTDLRTDLVYRLRIVVTDADQGLRQGMPVTIQLEATHAAPHKKVDQSTTQAKEPHAPNSDEAANAVPVSDTACLARNRDEAMPKSQGNKHVKRQKNTPAFSPNANHQAKPGWMA